MTEQIDDVRAGAPNPTHVEERHHDLARSAEQPGCPGSDMTVVASSEAAVVFTSLASRCVPEVCDGVVIDLRDDGAPYRVVNPSDAVRVAQAAIPVGMMRLPFSHGLDDAENDPAETALSHGLSNSPAAFDGVAVFVWQRQAPTAAQRLLIAALLEQAVRTVAWQRSEQRARDARTKAANLEIALRNSRQIGAAIGILMSQNRVTQEKAFDLLREASQRSNRKLHDLVLDVLDTGWLDPGPNGDENTRPHT